MMKMMNFHISEKPQYGLARLSKDGNLFYRPNDYFFGKDVIIVALTEINMPKGIQANVIKETITIHVREIPFAPMLYFASMSGTPNSSDLHGLVHVSTEGNRTMKSIGSTYICDYNPSDDLSIMYTITQSNVSLILTTMSTPGSLDNMADCFDNNHKVMDVQLVTDEDFHGVVCV